MLHLTDQITPRPTCSRHLVVATKKKMHSHTHTVFFWGGDLCFESKTVQQQKPDVEPVSILDSAAKRGLVLILFLNLFYEVWQRSGEFKKKLFGIQLIVETLVKNSPAAY